MRSWHNCSITIYFNLGGSLHVCTVHLKKKKKTVQFSATIIRNCVFVQDLCPISPAFFNDLHTDFSHGLSFSVKKLPTLL